MEYRLLGRSGLKVSSITMGTMTFGGVGWAKTVGDLGVSEAKRLVDMCLDAGVNLIDTADVYSQGASEEILGEIIGGPRKNGVLIQACEASLKRMKTDVIDLYQLHEWDGQTPLEETMEALDTLIRQGKVRYIGCSNFSGWHIMKALGVSERDKRERFVSQQIHYTLEARDAEYELLPVSIDQGLGVLVWSPIAGGLLSGKHRRNQATPEGTRQFAGWTEPPIRDENRLWNIVDTLVEIADGRGVSAAQVALAWLIGRKGVTSVIIGGRTDAQFKDNLASAELKLTEEERKRLDDVSLLPLLYPYWHQRNTATDRLSDADLSLIAPHLAN
ncbi:aldo/keto reductase [Rhizobium sp. CB3171]|uniref:aldo/keto reductase n=1 Tax=Rhizobium sp. CB3171 TaxID=3039157 RepID=UPI0024B1AFAC|nr:aldo/keto reductase [Rhizobium sp. CB3171]WFU03790.1 aldo/keto reductase [Rhizobium sp. CB3171]